MLNKLIKILGGYTQAEFKQIQKDYDKFKNTFDEIPEDEIKVGDTAYFYYVSRIDYQTSRYHAGTVEAVKSTETSDGTRMSYVIKCTDSERFNSDLILSIREIALSKRKLRDKIVNSDRWTFLTYMTYDNKEKRIPRNEKFEAEISK